MKEIEFLRRALKGKPVIIATAVCVLLIAGVLVFSSGLKAEATVLLVDGKELAVVTDEKQVEEALDRMEAEYLEKGIALAACNTQITYDDTKLRAKASPVNDQTLYTLLRDRLVWEVECGAIEIDGEKVIYLASEEVALATLEKIKKYYVPENDEQLTVDQVGFVENVQAVAGQATFDAIKDSDAALAMLIQGKDKLVQHTVAKGDSLWSIALDNNLTVAELQGANPELGNGNKLKPGMSINLVKVEPLVRVATVVTTTVEEKIPYGVSYKNDSTLWRGQQSVQQKGKYGSRQVTYRITKTNEEETNKETLDEILLQEPVNQVVLRGTKVMVASRGAGGSGVLGWPLRGKITSAYGARRGSGAHTGLDIDGNTGDPILAAESGVVLEAGWKGNYGNCVILDHGDGLTTLYAHQSKIKVSPGQSVNRGDIIGLVGSTGKSTGSHLHLEVRINGVRQNPKRFLD